MAIFIPETFDFASRPDSELTVLEAIRQNFSNDWTVLYSLSFLRHRADGSLGDGETDFLLCHERYGILVLEVKGGHISYRNGRWMQNDHETRPFDQARTNKYALQDIIQNGFGLPRCPVRLAHAVCFPNCPALPDTLPPEAQGIVFTAPDLEGGMEEKVTAIINRAGGMTIHSSQYSLDEILKILVPDFDGNPQPAVPAQSVSKVPRQRELFEASNKTFQGMTDDLRVLTDALRNFPRLQFLGGAGTGKTFLASAQAEHLAAQGKSVLYLCFNELLARRVAKQLAHQHNVTVAAFFRFCLDMTYVTEEEFEKYKNDKRLYDRVLPFYLGQRLEKYPLYYDAILVDEAQDFTEEMWKTIPLMLHSKSLFYIFYDPEQNIFHDHLHLPSFDLPPIVLTKNRRNTQAILEAMKPYHDIETEAMESTPMGTQVIEYTGNCRENLVRELSRLFKGEKIQRHDVVILGGHSLPHTCLADDHKVGDYTVEEYSGLPNGQSVAYYTYMKFKGCEASVVILLEVDETDPRWDRQGLYTAMSRAVNQLIILRK